MSSLPGGLVGAGGHHPGAGLRAGSSFQSLGHLADTAMAPLRRHEVLPPKPVHTGLRTIETITPEARRTGVREAVPGGAGWRSALSTGFGKNRT